MTGDISDNCGKGTHNTKKVYCQINKQTYDIDEDIADLLKVMWDLDIETYNSCQCEFEHEDDKNKFGKVVIGFESVGYKTFMSLIMNYNSFSDDETEIYDLCMAGKKFYSKFHMIDNNEPFRGENEEFMKNESGALLTDVHVICQLWFPKEYINKIIEKLKRHYDRNYQYNKNMEVDTENIDRIKEKIKKLMEQEMLTNDQIKK